jgi:transposase
MFTAQFKQEQLARIDRQELTVAELAREISISPQLVRQWQRLSTGGSTTAVTANEEVVPVSELRAAQQRIKELERALGKKAMEIEILHAARDEVKKRPRFYGVSKR